ncbi:MAG: 3-oxoacyl-[acyl-carrier-protein] reductase [Alphaproteobacteria bacterium]|nr:3-oxoacyl-[acyl-carrier-protein] reductase [Alphaproteobacteria bacterium]
MFGLEGRKALVTGASGGIGGAVARALHAAGASVVLSGTRKAALDALAADLGARAHVAVADLSTGQGVEALVKEAESAMGGIDILVNNAGLTRDQLLLRMKDEDWQQVLDVNLTAAFRLSRGVLRGMMRARFGRIVSITSVVGTTGNPGQANYAASKAGLTGFTKSLAMEVASRNITVNCVAPGFVVTAMTDALSDDQRNRAIAAIPVGRFGDPADVAAAVVYLASDEAAYVTGQTLHVNGGMAMI